MPKVGSQKFPYTSSGIQKAQKHARTTGQKVDMDGYKKGGSPRPSTKKVKTNWQARATGRGKSLPNIGKPTPQSGGRTARKGSSSAGLSGYKHSRGLGTHRLSSTAEKRYAHSDAWYKDSDSPKKNRPGQKSSVQKAKTRLMQRTGERPDVYVGKGKAMSGGRDRAGSGLKHSLGAGYKTGGKVKKKKGGKVKLHHGGRGSGGMKDKQC